MSNQPCEVYLVDCVLEGYNGMDAMSTVPQEYGRASAELRCFVISLITKANLSAPETLAAVVYITRAKKLLAIGGDPLSPECLCLGAFIAASKV